MADRHIATGNRHIVQQEELLATMRMDVDLREEAEKLLTTFKASLVQHHTHREAILAALEADGL